VGLVDVEVFFKVIDVIKSFGAIENVWGDGSWEWPE
jgi:hypothetical protein